MLQVESVKDLVQALGGLTATARGLGHKNPSTVHGWLKSGSLPHWRIPEVLTLAESKNLPVTREMLEQLSKRTH